MPGLLLSSLATTACPAARNDTDPILILAAASTIDALEAALDDFGARTGREVASSFGPTSTLVRQVEQGAPADLVLSASSEWADHLEARVEIDRRATLVRNRLVLIVPKSAEVQTGPLVDLLGSNAADRIAIADPEAVPAGIYARQALQGLGLWESLRSRLIPTADARAATALVAAREADFGLVYATDAASSERLRTVAEVDPATHAPIEYPLLLVADAAADASGLFDFLVSASGRAHFFDRGFIDPDP